MLRAVRVAVWAVLLILWAVAGVICLRGQNPATALFPSAIATDTDLFVAADRATSTLSGSIGASDLTIGLADGTTFRAPAIVTIDAERIKVCSKTGNSLTVCAGGRGYCGSTAASHSSNAAVNAFITSCYDNQLRAEVKAIETQLGVNLGNIGRVATLFSGSDLGAQVNAAVASFGGGTCGTVMIPPGTYTFPTQIVLTDGCVLAGFGMSPSGVANTRLIYSGPAGTSAIVFSGSGGLVRDLDITDSGVTGCLSGGYLSWNPDAGGANKWQCMTFGAKKTITGATNASPISITTSAAHGYATNDVVYQTYIKGNLAANGRFVITVSDTTHYTLNGSTGNGAYTSGGTAEKLTYSAAAAHLAGIQWGGIDPTVIVGRINNSVRRVGVFSGVVEANGGLSMTFGLFYNGDEHSLIEDAYVLKNEIGIWFNTASQPVGMHRASFRLNRLAGIWMTNRSIPVTCDPCLAESNEWFFGNPPPRPADLDHYGAGIRFGELYPGMGAGDNGGISGDIYVENNDIDIFSTFITKAGFNLRLHGSPGGYLSATSPRGQFYGSLLGCGATLDPAFVYALNTFTVSANCLGAAPPGARDPGVSSLKLVIQDGATSPLNFIGAVQKVYAPGPSATAPMLNGYQLEYGPSNALYGPVATLRSAADYPTVQGRVVFDLSEVGPYAQIHARSTGSGQNLLAFYDSADALSTYVTPAGGLAVKPSGSQPACASGVRGMYWLTQGGAGVKDKVEVCAKDAADAYAWRTIY